MLANILRNTEWKQLTSFVSPAFFDVLPPRKLYRRARALLMARDAPAYKAAVTARRAALRALPLSIVIAEQADKTPPVDDGLGQGANGERIVTLYFQQLFDHADTLLDLRTSSLRDQQQGLVWSPAAWVAHWDPAFIKALRDVYRGFYANQDATFRRGLAALDLAACEDLFREHFGSDQRAHVFRTKEFVATFHKVFLRCRDHGIELHPDFLALGIYLACLHDALDARGQPVDVRACFERVVGTTHEDRAAHAE